MADVVVKRGGGLFGLLIGGIIVYLYFRYISSSCGCDNYNATGNGNASLASEFTPKTSSPCNNATAPPIFIPTATDVNLSSGRGIEGQIAVAGIPVGGYGNA